jgi:hypothetical protein
MIEGETPFLLSKKLRVALREAAASATITSALLTDMRTDRQTYVQTDRGRKRCERSVPEVREQKGGNVVLYKCRYAEYKKYGLKVPNYLP